MSSVNQRVKEERLKNNLTKKQLAELLGVSVKTVTRMETENKKFKISYLTKLHYIFGIDVDYLLCMSDIRKKSR